MEKSKPLIWCGTEERMFLNVKPTSNSLNDLKQKVQGNTWMGDKLMEVLSESIGFFLDLADHLLESGPLKEEIIVVVVVVVAGVVLLEVAIEDLLLDVEDLLEEVPLVEEVHLAEDIPDHVLVQDPCQDHPLEAQGNEVIPDQCQDHVQELLQKRAEEVLVQVEVVPEVQVLLVAVKVVLQPQKRTQRNEFSIFT